ncbi:hypothetical protein HF872_02005 [Megasphaera hexanoica]|uniref:SLH domain-containing protein n=1 Tax=Megasphaera hexanoica TaxID=1675036 RepID=A0A848BQ55_9FIRM|nr:ESPR-type extended signal peptide-containing protein [Megasphaera hexanoica]NME27405.1 hypothetical protein [Megasphaera hexanoica]
MNKIFKVIWSKSRNCYVVASELAKGRTKAASTGDKAKRLALAAITALMLLPVGGYSYAANISIGTATINDSAGKQTTVFTGNQTAAEAVEAAVEQTVPYNSKQIGILQHAVQSVEEELAQHQSLIDNLGTDKLTLSSDNTLQKETYDSTTKTTTTTNVTGLKVAGPISANSASISGTLSAGGAVNAGSVNSRGNITAVGTIAGQTVTATGTMKGKDLIGSNSIISQGTIAATGNISSQATVGAKEMVSQTNITAKNKVVGMQGVVDNTLTSGNYVTAGNTVGENIVALDTQVKANADQFTTDKTSTALHVSKDGNLIVGTKENQTVKDLKIRGQLTSGSISTGDITSSGDVSVAGKVEAEAVYDDTTKTGNYVVQTNSVGANLSALDTQVKSNADAIAEKANAADVYTKAETDQKVDAANTYTYRKVAAEEKAREAADNELNERITNEANAIHDEIKAGDEKLDTRITNVKEYLEKQTSDNYVSKTDAAVQDGAIVKADKTIGENVTNLDAALAKETAARIGADAAQDKVIQQVNQNMVDGFNTINKNMADGFTALNQADAKEAAERKAADTVLDDKITAETSARVAADTKLVEAVNSGLSLSNDNVLQKNTTTIDAQGNVTTSKTDANEMILNKGNDNQITMNENGIKVGTNSTVVDKDGVYTGGDTYSEAKAAMSADGKIKGANGAFTVDENGNVTSTATITGETVTDGKGASMSNGTVTGKTLTDGIATITNGNINTSGSITGGTVTSTGNISALGDIHAGGAITGASASIQGALTAGSATITGDLTAGGAIQGKSISDGTATMQNGNLTGVKNLSAETITTSGNATIGGDLTVNGKLNVDEIDLTKNGIVGDNNVTASTKVAAGEITSYKKATSTKDGSEKESAIDYDENGTSTWAKSTDADGNWNKSTLTVEGNDVTSKVIDSEKNSNLSTQTSTQSQSTLKDKDSNTNTATQSATESSSVLQDKEGKTSTFQQRVDEILNQINSSDTVFSKVDQKVDNISSEVTDGTNTTSSTQTTTDITNTASNGTITNEAKDLVNHATENMTNTVGKDLTTTVGGEMKTTVTGKVTEDYKSDLDTKVGGNETHYVAGNQTNTVSGDRTVSVKGTETENFNAQVTNVKTDQRTSVGGNQTNIVAGNQQNTVSGSKTETVKGSVTEKYGSQATTVDSDQSTNVGGNQFNVVAGDQTNTISGSKTESVKGAVTETYGSQSTTVNGNQSNTVKGTLTETVTGDVTEDYKANLSTTVGGNQTTTVTGDSSLTAENITNEAKNKITNKAIDVETDATSSIVQKVTNDAGSNTSTQLSYQTTEEMSQADGKTASYLRGAAEEKSQLIDGSNKTTIDTIAGQTNTNITDGTNTSNDLQKADQIASSVTDGTNTTVVNQDAKSLASSITDGTKSNNTNNTVDKSEQLIKASDSQYNASVKTATTSTEKLVSGSIIDILKDADNGFVNTTVSTSDGTSSTSVSQGSADITNTAKQGTITNDAKNLVNKAEEKLSNSAAEIENTATTSIKDTVGKSTVTTTTDGTTFENTDHNTAIGDGSITKTTISGNTLETGKATMDYAEVMKDLTVGGTTTTKDLHVTNNATIDGTLDVAGAANFQDTVTVAKDLSVGGNASVSGSMTASSYKVGDKTYIDDNGINANNQKITNVAAGELSANSLDAVNGSQLYETNRRVSKMDSRINEVGANAAAMANLHPLEFDADSKFNVAAAVGNYKNETATALGLFYRPNEDVMVNLSGTVGSDDNMIGGGVAVRIGRGGNKARNKQMAESAKYVKNLESQVNTLQHQMDALLSVLNPNLSKEFPDVPENHWAYEAVSRLAGNGIIQGYEDGKYHGERTMTRYEMAEIIYKALQKGAKAEAKLVEEFKPELKAMAAQNKA